MGLPGARAPGLGDDGQRPFVVEWSLDHDQVVLHLDDDAVVSAAGQIPDAVGHHLGGDLAVEPGRRPGGVGHLDVDGHVGFHVGHREIQRRESAGRLANARRELHAAEVPVLGVGDLDRRVAQDGVGYHRLDALHQVPVAERGPDGHASGHREDDHAALDGGVVGGRRLDDSMRGGPQLELSLGQGDRSRDRRRTRHVPGVVATQPERLPLLAADGLLAAAAHRVVALHAHELIAERGGLVVDGAGEALDGESWPRVARHRALPEGEVDAVAAVLERLEAVGTEGYRGRGQRGAGVLGGGGQRQGEQQCGRQRERGTHAGPPCAGCADGC